MEYHSQSAICHPHTILELKYKCTTTNLLVNTRFFYVLDEAKLFDHFIETKIPTPRCLLQSIDGPLKFAYFATFLGSTEPSGCVMYTSSVRFSVRKVILTSIYYIS
jgi:hypothetical protein